jgi:lipopolysaccharide export system protein LptA
MRRTSVFLALAAIFLTALVGFTYWLRLSQSKPHTAATPTVDPGLVAIGRRWGYNKDDPTTNRPIVRVEADSFQDTKDPSVFALKGLSLRLYDKHAGKYTLVKAASALFDEGSGVMRSQSPVSVVMNVPADVAVNDSKVLDKHVHVETSGVTYETKSGKVSTDQLAKFVFPEGDGQAIGADYDPNLRILHLRSAVSLDWIGSGPPENKVHVETSDLIYKELEQKIYLTPWSKMQRQTLTIQAQSSIVTLEDQRLHQIDSVAAVGTDNRNGRLVEFAAANMMALFNEDGALEEVVGDKNAHVSSAQTGAKTMLTGDRADLVFEIQDKTVNGQQTSDSQLHAVTADGHAVAISQPLPLPGVLQGDTRILRSEHILLTMRPGGQEVQEINAPQKATLEFKPNRPGLPHRVVDASKLRVLYGDNSYVEAFTASDVKTRTDKPPDPSKNSGKPPAPAYTWSDEMFAKFKKDSNEVESIDQKGHFRYQEGERKANSETAQLLQDINRITLKDKARVLDDTGSTYADLIVMDQASGDMDASGHVRSTRLPDKNQKPGTSMLDATQSMQAQADKMVSRENNTKVLYTGHAVLWQGANRISAESIDIDRDEESLHASQHVVSELVDNRDTTDSKAGDAKPGDAKTKEGPAVPVAAPIFTIVRAPDLVYHDDTRIALYTGGVTLVRDQMTVTSDRMRAILTPKTDSNKGDSSLDHAIGDGNVKIFEEMKNNRTRTGTSEHCDYFTKDDKVVLSGGDPQFIDSQKGVTRGRQLTYFSSDDKMIVEGEDKHEAFTRMKKH